VVPDGGVVDAEEFCRSVHARLVRSLASYTGDPALAEELAQEALARAWERWDRVQRMDAPSMWVYRTALNLARSAFRRRGAERRALARLAGREATPEADRADIVAVRTAILELPPRQRAAVVLRYHADLSVEETADVLQCAPGTVKALTSQAISRMRAQFEPELTEDAR
jgi:RNA polymerase sigma-70 factor (sigma-E family)